MDAGRGGTQPGWLVHVPGRAEACWLAGDRGPFRADRWGQRMAGQVEIVREDSAGVWVRLDRDAFHSLAHVGGVDGYADGRITWDDGPVMHIGGAACTVIEE